MLYLSGGCAAGESDPGMPLSAADLAVFDEPMLLASWREPGSWPMRRHDPLQTGRIDVDLGTTELELAWQFQPSIYARSYEPTYATWTTPIAGTVDGRPMLFVGSYDHNLYAVDVRTGKEVWRHTAGAPVLATPALGYVKGKPAVFVPARDRNMYALDAATGKPLWQYETREWTFTAVPSLMTSPTVIETDGKTLVYVGVWNADRSATGNVQRGEMYCFNADDGSVRWQERTSSTPGASPAIAPIDGRLTLFSASQAGVARAMDALTGKTLWEFTLDNDSRSAPAVGAPDGYPRVYLGTRFNACYGLDARTGKRRMRYQTGNWVDSAPALLGPRDDLRLVVGSFDFSLYTLPARTAGRHVDPVWTFRTGNWVHTSAAVARVGDKPVVLTISWDAKLYMLGGDDGAVLWSYSCGDLLWSHVEQGDALWGSATVATADGKPYVYYAAYDGVVYALRGKAAPAPTTTTARSVAHPERTGIKELGSS